MGAIPTSADGQPLGERGLRTRQRILEAIGAAIQRHGLRGIRLADIAQEVGFKPPAFYQYFTDLDEAILALCEEAGDLLPRFEIDSDDWGDSHPQGTRPFVEQFFDYWDEHRPLLTARHVAIMSGEAQLNFATLPAVVPQYEILDGRGRFVARVDLAIPSVKLGLEAHSRRFHFGPQAEPLDEQRDVRVAACGWELLYLGWYSAKRPAEVVTAVAEVVEARRRALRAA